MTARLRPAVVDRLPAGVVRPGYDWAGQGIGIVHLGLGAFHRAHQALYTDAAMAGGDRDWGIAGVSLRSPGVRDTLAPQDGLYTVTERRAGADRTTLVGAIRAVVVAPERPGATAALIARAGVHVVTLTVTEKAYHRGADNSLDVAAVEAAGATIYHHIAQGLAERRAQGRPGLTLVSCDNLADNGGVLAGGIAAWLDHTDPALRRWFEAECACPATMVDRIVPATTAADLDRVAAAIGCRDEAAVITEPFRQWVIQDRFAGPRPRWEEGGAQLVADVAPFEAAKLRMLNGAHSALAYLGLIAGHDYVHQAIADPAIAVTVDRLIRREAAASLDPVPGQDLSDYADALLTRFRNPALPHRLAQIASDGSQKVAQRWLAPLAINTARGHPCPATLRALAAWLIHVRGDGAPVVDPLADTLAATWASAGRQGIIDAIFRAGGPFAAVWRPRPSDKAALQAEIDSYPDPAVPSPP